MAVPKRRVSKQRRNTRKAHWKLSVPGIVACPQCGGPVLSHRVCKSCGYYKGSKVVPDKVKAAE